MPKYLVCRLEAIRPAGTMRSSNHFPLIVTLPRLHGIEYSAEEILEKALDSINEGYRPNYEYIVMPIVDAKVVAVKPRRDYLLEVRDF